MRCADLQQTRLVKLGISGCLYTQRICVSDNQTLQQQQLDMRWQKASLTTLQKMDVLGEIRTNGTKRNGARDKLQQMHNVCRGLSHRLRQRKTPYGG